MSTETETVRTEIAVRTDFTVELLRHMGGDDSIVQAMMVSTQGVDSLEAEANYGRINYLMKHRHGTPFEHCGMTFYIEAPIFVFREFHRHRIGWSYNEVSGRYRQLDAMFYVPAWNRPLINVGTSARPQMAPAEDAVVESTVMHLGRAYSSAYRTYETLLEDGVAKEVARACLPVGIYTAMHATCNARSLMAFLSLRTTDLHAKFPSYPQWEIEQVARAMEAEFEKEFPLTYKAFCENGRVAP